MASFKSNLWKVYTFKFFTSMHFFSAVLVPFFTDWGGISFTKVMVLQSWFVFCMFALEVPTGAVADCLGRKTSLALSAIVGAVALVVYSSKPDFYIFMIGESLMALSSTLLSGADEAFVYDTLEKIGESSHSTMVFARLESFKLAGMLVAAPLGSLFAAWFGLRAPVLFMAVPFLIAFAIALTFKEPELIHQETGPRNYIAVLRDGVKFFHGNSVLKILAFDMISIATVAYFMLWLYQPMLKQAGIGIAYFGIVHAALVVAQIMVVNNYAKLERIIGSKRRVLFISSAVTGFMFILGGLTTYAPVVLLAVVICCGFGLSRRPLFVSYMNKYIPSPERATVLSTISMLRRFVLVFVNPVVGLLADWSLNNTLIILGASALIFSLVSRVEEKHLLD